MAYENGALSLKKSWLLPILTLSDRIGSVIEMEGEREALFPFRLLPSWLQRPGLGPPGGRSPMEAGSSSALPCTLAGSWISAGAAGAWAGASMACGHCQVVG